MDQDQSQQQYQVMQVIGAIKIKDGLFIGDEFASKDLEFIVTNKVTHIINCSGQQIQNNWENIGVQYLTFPWMENDQQILFDQNDENLNEIFNFVEESVEQGESTLVHSVRGQSRSCCVLAAYLMKKFKWTLYKTLEYLNTRRPDLEIRASFFHQLTALEQKMARQGEGAKSASWQELSDESGKIESEELLVRNTFLNARNAPIADIFSDPQANFRALNKDVRAKMRWKDNGLNDKSKLNYEEVPYENFEIDIRNGKKNGTKKAFVKSCLKGSGKILRVANSNSVSNELENSQKENISLRSSTKNPITGSGGNNFSMLGSGNQPSPNQIPQKQMGNPLPYSQNLAQQQQSPLLPSQQQLQQQQQSQQQSLQQQLQQSKKPLGVSNQQTRQANNITSQNQQSQAPTLKQNKSAKCILEESNSKDQYMEQQNQQQIQNYSLQQSQQQQQSSFIMSDSKPPTITKSTPPLSLQTQQVTGKDQNKSTPPIKNLGQNIKVTSTASLNTQNNGAQKSQSVTPNGNSQLPTQQLGSSFVSSQQFSQSSLQKSPLTPQQQQQQQQQQYAFNQQNNQAKGIHRSSSLSNFDKEKDNQQGMSSGVGISQLHPGANHLNLSLERGNISTNSSNQQNNLKISSNGKPYQFLSPNNQNAFQQNQNQINFSNSISGNFNLNKNGNTPSTNSTQLQYSQNSQKKEIPSPLNSSKIEDTKNKQRSYTTTSITSNNQPSSIPKPANQNDNSIHLVSSNKNKPTGLASPLPLPQQQTPQSANQHQYRSNSVPKRMEEGGNNSSSSAAVAQNSILYSTSSGQGFNNSNSALNQNKRPQSASAKDKKDSYFSSSSSQQQQMVNNSSTNSRLNAPYPYQPMSNKNQFSSQIDTKASTFNSKKDLLNGISPNNHSQLVNPNKPYQRGESPSIKQKEKMQKQHQLKMQQQQQQQQLQQQQQAQSQQKRNLYGPNNTAQQYANQSIRQGNLSNALPPTSGMKQNNEIVVNENQLYPQQMQGNQSSLNNPQSSSYVNMISAKKPPTSNNQKEMQGQQQYMMNNNQPLSLTQNQSSVNNILREQDSNKVLSQNVQEQMNQINQISNNLMKTLLHFQPQSTTNQQNSNNLSIKNTGNSSGFIKQSGGPIRATGEALPNTFKQSNNTSSGQQLLMNNFVQEENNPNIYKVNNHPSQIGSNGILMNNNSSNNNNMSKNAFSQISQPVGTISQIQTTNMGAARPNSTQRSFSPQVKGVMSQNNNSNSKQSFENNMLLNQQQQSQQSLYQQQQMGSTFQQSSQSLLQQQQQQQIDQRQRLRSNSPASAAQQQQQQQQQQPSSNLNSSYSNQMNLLGNNGSNLQSMVTYNNMLMPQNFDNQISASGKPKWKF